MKRILYLLFISALLFSCEKPNESNSEGNVDNKEISVTLDASHISCISAILSGKANLGKTIGADLKMGIMYSKSSGVVPSSSTTVEATDIDANYRYSITITDLEPATTYYYRSYVYQNGETSLGDTKSFNTKDVASMLVTLDAEVNSPTVATLKAHLDLTDYPYTSIVKAFQYGTSKASLDNSFSGGTLSGNILSRRLTSLLANTKYYYRVYLKLDDKEYLGEVKDFTTDAVEISISELNVSEVGVGTATISGKLGVLPEGTYSKSGNLYYKKSDEASYGKAALSIASDGTFSAELSNLSSDTQYVWYSEITVAGTTFKGQESTFRTLAIDATLTSLDATGTGLFKACMNSSLTVNNSESLSTNVWFLYSSSATALESLKSSGTKVTAYLHSDGFYATNLTSLSYGTTYYYVACSNVYDKEFYGEVKSFTTVNLDDVVSITTNPASDIKISSATLNGSLAVNSTENLSESVWFLWSKTANSAEALKSSGAKETCSLNSDGSFTSSLTNLSDATTYYYVSCSKVYDKEFYGEVKSFTTESIPEIVDLGLSVKWRAWNLGASRPEEYGDYYAWGETEPKSNYLWSTYKWCNGSSSTLTKYNTNSSYGAVDDMTEFKDYNYEDDAARKNLGSKWRTPTDAEWTELLENCSWTLTTDYNGTGVVGRIVTSKKTGYTDKSIFLPAAGLWNGTTPKTGSNHGNYWSSSLNTDYPYYARSVHFGSDGDFRSGYRYDGQSVRPVCEE